MFVQLSLKIFTILFVIYAITSTLVMFINPAEFVGKSRRRISPTIDFINKSRFKHVIENNFCNICQSNV